MAIYYIDSANGNSRNSGLSEKEPLLNDENLKLEPGDTVLFKRGSFIRGNLNNKSGAEGKPITYGAYGEGDLPVFCGSIDISDSKLWQEEEENIWRCKIPVNDETGNIVFNKSDIYGTLRWTKEELCEQGDFFDSCFGYRIQNKPIPDEHKLYMYSQGNPGEVYSSVEQVIYRKKILADNGHDMVFENLRFINSGCCAIAGEYKSRNLKVRGCVFENIGGCVWDASQKIRYGNAVEFWNVAENIEVSGCVFNNIYDSGVTHQGSEICKPCENVIFKNNLFIKCGMAAYEQRDRLPKYAVFNENICVDAGEGFSKQGETMPRFSEIWPQPMGHHIFLWRINSATENGKMEIKNNIFCNAPYGAAIYSIIVKDAEDKISLEGNTYCTQNSKLFNRWNGNDFKMFDEYKKCEKNCRYRVYSNNEILAEAKKIVEYN